MKVAEAGSADRCNDCKKLLDNGFRILMYRNGLGSYTAVALRDEETLDDIDELSVRITDDWEPAKALYRLTEKVICGNIVDWTKK